MPYIRGSNGVPYKWYRESLLKDPARAEATLLPGSEQRNRLHIVGEISEQFAQQFRAKIESLDSSMPLDIVIDTSGGGVLSASSIFDLITSYPGETVGLATNALSAGGYILQACKIRTLTASGTLMVHNAWTSGEPTVSDLKLLAMLDKRMVQAYAKRSIHNETVISRWLQDETWFTAQEALRARLIDKIL